MFTFQLPKKIGTTEPINLEGSLKVMASPDLLQLVKVGLSIAINQLLVVQQEALEANASPAKYLNHKLLQAARSIVNNESELERYSKVIIRAGIVRGVFYHDNPATDYIPPSDIGQTIMNLLSNLLSDDKLISEIFS